MLRLSGAIAAAPPPLPLRLLLFPPPPATLPNPCPVTPEPGRRRPPPSPPSQATHRCLLLAHPPSPTVDLYLNRAWDASAMCERKEKSPLIPSAMASPPFLLLFHRQYFYSCLSLLVTVLDVHRDDNNDDDSCRVTLKHAVDRSARRSYALCAEALGQNPAWLGHTPERTTAQQQPTVCPHP